MEHGYAARQLKIKKTARKKRHARGPHTCCTTGTMTHTALKFFLILATDCKILLPSLSVCVCVCKREAAEKPNWGQVSHTHCRHTHTSIHTHYRETTTCPLGGVVVALKGRSESESWPQFPKTHTLLVFCLTQTARQHMLWNTPYNTLTWTKFSVRLQVAPTGQRDGPRLKTRTVEWLRLTPIVVDRWAWKCSLCV